MTVDPVLLTLAGSGLPGVAPPVRTGWSHRLDDVFGHGLAGFLAAAWAADLVDLGDTSVRRLRRRLESEAIRAVQLEGELIRLTPVLAGLPAVVLKGAVLAHAAYPDPSLRPFTDLDLVVVDARQRDAVAMLEALGYERGRPEPAPGYDARVGKALALVHPGGVVVDLHRTLVAGLAGASIDISELLAGRRAIPLGGATIPGPSWEAHLVEVALHAVLGDGLARALSLRDVAQVALHRELDAEHALDVARRWRVTQPVGEALRAASDAWDLELPGPLAALAGVRAAPDPVAPGVSSARTRMDELRNGGLRRRMTLTRALVVPSRDFLRWGYGDGSTAALYGKRWRTLARRAGEARTTSDPAGGPPSPDASTPSPVVAGSVPRSHPASRQERWTAARPPRAGRGSTDTAASGAPPSGPPPPATGARPPEPAPPAPEAGIAVAAPPPSGVGPFVGGISVLLLTALAARAGVDASGVVFIPIAGLLFAWAAARRIARRRPEEAWAGRWLVLGVAVKIAASYVRYLTLIVSYEGVGDASLYDAVGRQFAQAWMGNGVAPHLENLKETNFLKWFTGVVYFLFGSNTIAGGFVFGLLALVGSYLWYRATVEAVPWIDKRLYLGLVLFAPSIAFWPSSIGKESLMQLGVGAAALATAYFLRQQLFLGILVGAAGGWLLWVVRPHLLAMVTIAAGFAYLAGRVRPKAGGSGKVLGRTAGLLVLAFLVAFTIGQGAKFLGLKDLSLSSVETKLEEQSTRNTGGGSSFDSGGDYLSPQNLPRGAATVLLRPFPWETTSPFQLLASLESVIVAGFIVVRLPSLKNALVRARAAPFLLYCWILTLLYAATFASFSNFGLLVRQRSLVLPALFVLLSVLPRIDDPEPDPDGSEPAATVAAR
jgi:hypothetical protein